MKRFIYDQNPDRLLPDVEFPSYTFIPGESPHPERDPEGHSYRERRPQPQSISTETWNSSSQYLYGFDLFNYGYYWEAHESWESIWQIVKKESMLNNYFKGLIKTAAAGVKVYQKNPTGFESHLNSAEHHFINLKAFDKETPFQKSFCLDLLAFVLRQRKRSAHIFNMEINPPERVFDRVLFPAGV